MMALSLPRGSVSLCKLGLTPVTRLMSSAKVATAICTATSSFELVRIGAA